MEEKVTLKHFPVHTNITENVHGILRNK